MTTRKDFVLRCNGCYEEKTWSLSSLRSYSEESLIESSGYTTETTDDTFGRTKHYCPDCNIREKDIFYVYDGHGEGFLGSIEAWNIIDARRVAWEKFEEEHIVKREEGERE